MEEIKKFSYIGTDNSEDHRRVILLGEQFGLRHIRKMTIGEKIADLANKGNAKAISVCIENPQYFATL